MKIKIEIDESAAEDEVIIRCRGLTKQVAAVQRAVRDVTNASEKILLYKGNTEYYVTLSKILFFETDENGISAHTRDEVFYPQLGVKLCSMAGGGVQKIYMVFLREPSRRDRSGSDLFHLRDGFEIKMNFDRNVSCFIFVYALMHDDFFD